MKIITSYRSPNFTDTDIPVEFVVVHYTACTLERTLELFMDTSTEVSAHIVIDVDGSVYEVVPCLSGQTKRAWHAGKSRLEVSTGGESRVIESFNDRSIGIELVNLNGNIFPYTEAQYAALSAVIERFKGLYPALQRPEAVVGHEQIAGFRGKADPGRCFEWGRFYAVSYPNEGAPRREAICSAEVAQGLRSMAEAVGVTCDPQTGQVQVPHGVGATFFSGLSRLCEAVLSKN